jgi:uncharacterized protein YeaO (DUF488 family)
MSIVVKRVYDQAALDDGHRVLVDRLWPRGLSHALARVDLWLRDVAPSAELRRWYDHRVERWPEFQKRYTAELEDHAQLLDLLLDIERHRQRVTLLFAARERERNEAQVLADALRRRPGHSHH